GAAAAVVWCVGAGMGGGGGRHHGDAKMNYIRHDDALMTRYAHLTSINVRCGEVVAADARIGRVGSTGRATGPHLHFEVRIEGRAVNPTEAMRVAELQRASDSEEIRQLVAKLRSSANTTVSTID